MNNKLYIVFVRKYYNFLKFPISMRGRGEYTPPLDWIELTNTSIKEELRYPVIFKDILFSSFSKFVLERMYRFVKPKNTDVKMDQSLFSLP